MSVNRTILSGSAWTVIGFGTGQILRLAGNIALAAILFQEAFAIMAIATAIVQGLTMFSDLGLAPSVVQNKRGNEPAFLRTAWTIQAARGLLLTIIACAVAWPLASFYAANDPMAWQILWILPMVSLGTLIMGFQSSKLMTAARNMNVARITMLDLTAQVSGLAVTVFSAWITKSVYALALGTIFSAVVSCTLSHVVLKGPRDAFAWDPHAVREIIHFGKWIFLSTLIFFFSMQVDKLVFARLFPLHEVGVYSIAASLAVITPTLMGRLQSMIAFPLYSRTIDQQKDLRPVFDRYKRLMLGIGGLMVALCIAGAQTFVDIAYDFRYSNAGVFIPILAVAAWFSIIEVVYGAAFLASNKAQWVALVNGTKVATFCLLIVPATKLGGLTGAVFAVAIADGVKAIMAISCGRRIRLKNQRADILLSVYTIAVGFGVLLICQHVTPLARLPDFAKIACEFVLVTLAFALPIYSAYKQAFSAETTDELVIPSGEAKQQDAA